MSNALPHVMTAPRRTLKRDVLVVGCSLATGLLMAWGFGLSSTKVASHALTPQVAEPTAQSSATPLEVLRATIREELARSGTAAPVQRPPDFVAANADTDEPEAEAAGQAEAAKTPATPAQQAARAELENRIDERMLAGSWRVEDEQRWREESGLLKPEDQFELRRRLAEAWNDGSLRREFSDERQNQAAAADQTAR